VILNKILCDSKLNSRHSSLFIFSLRYLNSDDILRYLNCSVRWRRYKFFSVEFKYSSQIYYSGLITKLLVAADRNNKGVPSIA